MDAPVSHLPLPAEFLRSMPAVQRWLYVGGGVAALATVVLVLRTRLDQGRVAALNEERFTQSQADNALRQFSAAGLRDCMFENGRCMVPYGEQERYEAVLSQSSQESRSWVNRWQETDSLLGQFADGRQQQAQRDEARARLISELLARLPDVAHAEIIWDEEARVGWRRPPRVRATVYVQPKPDREISFATVDAVRRAVASSKAHLEPADVVVMDLQRMVTYSASDAASAGTEHERKSRETAAIRSRIESALSDIERVRVSVAIQEPEPTTTEHSPLTRANRPAAPSDETAIPLFLSVSNVGLEVSCETAGLDSRSDPVSLTMTDRIADQATSASRRVEVVNVSVRIPAEYLQQQLGARIPAGVQLAADDSERLVAQIEERIQQSVHRRVSELISTSDRQASVVVETEDLPLAAVETSPPPTPWYVAAIGGPGARTWSIWAVVFGFGASLCWWLRDVLEWHGHRAGTRGAPCAEDADTGNAEATNELTGPTSDPHAVTLHGVTTIGALLEQEVTAVRRCYAAHPVSDWALALRGETEAVSAQLLGALGAEQAAELRKAVRAHRPVRLREIEEAQQRILSRWSAAAHRAA